MDPNLRLRGTSTLLVGAYFRGGWDYLNMTQKLHL